MSSTKQSPFDWLLGSQSPHDQLDLLALAPHPDLFESELSELESSTDLSSLQNILTYNTTDTDFRSFHFRAPGDGLGMGPLSSISSASDTLSGYNGTDYDYDYDTYSTYSSSYRDFAASSNPTTVPQSSAAVDQLNFGAFNLSTSPVTTTSNEVKPSLTLLQSLMDTPSPTSTNSSTAVPAYDSYYPLPSQLRVSETGAGEVSSDPRKKYQCPSCPRAFARAFNLKTHLSTHDPNRIKSHTCRHPGCGRSFSRKHDLGRHILSIHQSHSSSATSAAKGVIAGGKGERVWCDGCGRGWIKGRGEACACGDEEDEQSSSEEEVVLSRRKRERLSG